MQLHCSVQMERRNVNTGKTSVLNTLQAGDFPGFYYVLGDEDATHSDLMETGQRFFAALYGQPLRTTTSEARYRIYPRKTKKPMRIIALPPTVANLYLHQQPIHNEGRFTQEWRRTSRVRIGVATCLETVVFCLLPTQKMDIDAIG